MSVLNAFQIVRPRAGVSGTTSRNGPSLAQVSRAAGEPVVLDRAGRPLSTLAPRRYGFGGAVIEGHDASQASNDRRRAIVRGGI